MVPFLFFCCIQIFLFCFVINIWYHLGGQSYFFCGSMISVFRCSQELIQIGFQFLYYGMFLLSAFSLAIIQHFSDSTKYFTWFFWNYLITIFHFDWNSLHVILPLIYTTAVLPKICSFLRSQMRIVSLFLCFFLQPIKK